MSRPIVLAAWQPEEPGEAILVERELAPKAEVQWAHELSPDLRRDLLPRVEVVLLRSWPSWLTPELPRMTNLRLVQCARAGVEHIPFPDLARLARPPAVATGSGWNADAVAEHAWALALACAKRVPRLDARMRQGDFPQSQTLVAELRGRTLGILGHGAIGSRVARFGKAFGMRVMALGRSRPFRPPVVGDLRQLPRVLRESDVLVVSLPLTEKTRGLLGRRELAIMKPDAVLVNVARAAIVDEAALFERLREHTTFHAGLDVWWGRVWGDEAFSPDHPFQQLPNVVMTPHVAALVEGWLPRALGFSAQNVRRYLAGDRPRNVVDLKDYVRDRPRPARARPPRSTQARGARRRAAPGART